MEKYDDGSGDKYYVGPGHFGTAYDTMAEAIAAHYTEFEDVSLFVTIKKTNGTVEYRIVNNAITYSDDAVLPKKTAKSDPADCANEALHWCVMKSIVTGRGNKVLDPKNHATRAESAAMIQRFCGVLEQ